MTEKRENFLFFHFRSCQCPAGYNGPRCQQTARSFRGNGWAWYPALEMCDNSHLSFEFITRKADGLLLYNGPIVPPEPDEIMVSGKDSIDLFVRHLRPSRYCANTTS